MKNNENFEVLDPQQQENKEIRNPLRDGILAVLVIIAGVGITLGGWDTTVYLEIDKISSTQISNFIDLDELARIQENPTIQDREKLEKILANLPDGHPMKEGVTEIFCRHFDAEICVGHNKSQRQKNSQNLERKARLEEEVRVAMDSNLPYRTIQLLLEKLCSQYHSDLCMYLDDIDNSGGEGDFMCHRFKNMEKLLSISKYSDQEIEALLPISLFKEHGYEHGLESILMYLVYENNMGPIFDRLEENGIFSFRHIFRVSKENLTEILTHEEYLILEEVLFEGDENFDHIPEIKDFWNKE